MARFIAGVVLTFLIAGSAAHGQRIDPAVVKAYAKLGARVGGWEKDSLSFSFSFGAPKNWLPGFQFRKFPKEKLPEVNIPFGLDFTAGAITDAEIASLAEVKNLAYVRFIQMTDGQLRALRKVNLLHLLTPHSHEAGKRPRAAEEVASLALDFSRLTDDGMKELVVLKNLVTLSLANTGVADAGLKEVGRFEKLSTLDLRNTQVTHVGLKELAPLKKLKMLSLRSPKVPLPISLPTTSDTYDPKDFPRKLGGMFGPVIERTPLTDDALRVLREIGLLHTLSNATGEDQGRPQSADQVHALNLIGSQVTDAGLKELTGLKNLATLALNDTQVTPAGLKELAAFKMLSLLYLDPTQSTDAAFRTLGHLDKLHTLWYAVKSDTKRPKNSQDIGKLDLRETQLTDAGIKELAVCSKMGILDLRGLKINDAGLKDLARLGSLKTLYLSSTPVTDAGMKQVAALKKLNSLYLSDTKVTDRGIKELAGLGDLRSLRLTNTQVTDAGLKEMKGLAKLYRLDLNGTKVTDAGLMELAGLPNLKMLELNRTEVTDAGIKNLGPLSKFMDTLYLDNTRITDAGMKQLATFERLGVVSIRGTQVSPAGIAALRMVRPKTQIVK